MHPKVHKLTILEKSLLLTSRYPDAREGDTATLEMSCSDYHQGTGCRFGNFAPSESQISIANASPNYIGGEQRETKLSGGTIPIGQSDSQGFNSSSCPRTIFNSRIPCFRFRKSHETGKRSTFPSQNSLKPETSCFIGSWSKKK